MGVTRHGRDNEFRIINNEHAEGMAEVQRLLAVVEGCVVKFMKTTIYF